MRSQKLALRATCATGKPDTFNLQAAHRHLKSAAPALPALSPQPCPLSNSPHFVLQSSRVTPGDCTGSTWNMPRSFARNAMPSTAALIGRRGTFSMRTTLPGTIPFAVSARKDTSGCWRTENRTGATLSIPVHSAGRSCQNRPNARSSPRSGDHGSRFRLRDLCAGASGQLSERNPVIGSAYLICRHRSFFLLPSG